jgi:hypothetical protein
VTEWIDISHPLKGGHDRMEVGLTTTYTISKSGPKPSQSVIGAFLYICRQLYNTCEGLLVLQQYLSGLTFLTP